MSERQVYIQLSTEIANRFNENRGAGNLRDFGPSSSIITVDGNYQISLK